MKTKNMLAVAYQLAAKSFVDKVDKQGRPYFEHCLQVMQNLNTDDDELKQIALLHDYLEDVYPDDMKKGVDKLVKSGFSQRVIFGIIDLTKMEDQTYEQYICAVKENIDSVLVKIADLKHNSDITRLKGLTEKDIQRMVKYYKTYIELMSHLDNFYKSSSNLN